MPSSALADQTIQFEIVHSTDYEYGESVVLSQHMAHHTPRALPQQQCLQYDLRIEPAPDVQATHTDYFGNETTYFALQTQHKHLTVLARSRVAIAAVPRPVPSATLAWERATDRAALPLDALECTFDPAPGQTIRELAEYARPSFPPGRPLIEGVRDLTGRIHADFTFDPKATTIATPLGQVFESRRGVCQDFARLEITCLRVLGMAARYVSGYLETVPPTDKPRRIGGDASHAWLAIYDPSSGWVDVDPTNNLFPFDMHITLAWGRDYSDVSPLRGVILGGGRHSLKVSVDVLRLPS
jgi:transglutaminase-like putative cysteine protease